MQTYSYKVQVMRSIKSLKRFYYTCELKFQTSTFSTFALETTDLLKGGHTGVAFLYAMLSMVVGCAVIFGVELLTGK